MKVLKFISSTHSTAIPLFNSRIRAGFPSPATDYMENSLSLDELLIKHAESTFFAQIEGDSMVDAGIQDGDYAVIDRSLQVKNNSLVLAYVDGEGFTIKRYRKHNGKTYLVPANKKYQAVEITEFFTGRIWGVVTSIIRKYV